MTTTDRAAYRPARERTAAAMTTAPALHSPDITRALAVLRAPIRSFGSAWAARCQRQMARADLRAAGLDDAGLPLVPVSAEETAPAHRPEDPRNRLVRQARESLRVALYFGDQMGISSARAQLAALGVDEAGDDVVAAPAVEEPSQ